MKYRVSGVTRDTGEDKSVFVEATDEATAAKVSGLMIESIEAIAPPNPLDSLAASNNRLDYHRASPKGVQVPEYLSVYLSGMIICAFGWVTIVVSMIWAAIIINEGVTSRPSLPAGIIALALAPAGCGLIAGLFQVGFGSLIQMARDTARHLLSK